ncbi:MAG: hypothetical protein ACK4UJ_05270 [Leptonema sp. (in: bacteria)]
MKAILEKSLQLEVVYKKEKAEEKLIKKKDNKILYDCICDLSKGKHKENCIYNLV